MYRVVPARYVIIRPKVFRTENIACIVVMKALYKNAKSLATLLVMWHILNMSQANKTINKSNCFEDF